MSAARKPKWRRRAEDRPDEILDAALEVFDERGFEATRVEDIAARALISKAGVYLYFTSKEEILRALIEREIAPVARKMRELAEAGLDDPLATLRAIVAGFAAVIANPKNLAVPRLVLSVAGRFPEIGAYYRTHVVEEAVGAFAALHRAGVEEGQFRDVSSIAAARAVVGPLMLHAVWTHVLGGDPGDLSPAERAEAHVDLVLRGLGAEEK
ncbi:MAG: TetR/AcrR family transcriptional regulator [Parvularculaceae bacterium]